MMSFDLPTNFNLDPKKLLKKVQPRVDLPKVTPPPTIKLVPKAPYARKAMAKKTLREIFVPSETNVATGPKMSTLGT